MRAATAFVITVFLVGCSSPQDPSPVRSPESEHVQAPASPRLSPAQALDQYAGALVANNSEHFSGHEPAHNPSSGRPPTYVITFRTVGAGYLTKKNIPDGDEAGYQANLAITERWQAVYCTEELKEIIRAHGLLGAHGHIEDAKGQKHSMAICTG